MERVLTLDSVMGAARGPAVGGDDVGVVLAQTLDPGDEAFREGFARQGVDDVVEGVMGRGAVCEGQKPAQKIELLGGPALDLDEIVGPGHGGAQYAEQDFGRGADHLAGLAEVFKGGKLNEQRFAGYRKPPRLEVSYESQQIHGYPLRSSDCPAPRIDPS